MTAQTYAPKPTEKGEVMIEGSIQKSFLSDQEIKRITYIRSGRIMDIKDIDNLGKEIERISKKVESDSGLKKNFGKSVEEAKRALELDKNLAAFDKLKDRFDKGTATKEEISKFKELNEKMKKTFEQGKGEFNELYKSRGMIAEDIDISFDRRSSWAALIISTIDQKEVFGYIQGEINKLEDLYKNKKISDEEYSKQAKKLNEQFSPIESKYEEAANSYCTIENSASTIMKKSADPNLNKYSETALKHIKEIELQVTATKKEYLATTTQLAVMASASMTSYAMQRMAEIIQVIKGPAAERALHEKLKKDFEDHLAKIDNQILTAEKEKNAAEVEKIKKEKMIIEEIYSSFQQIG